MRRLSPERWPGLSKVTERRGEGRRGGTWEVATGVSPGLAETRGERREHWWSGVRQVAGAGSPSFGAGGFLWLRLGVLLGNRK